MRPEFCLALCFLLSVILKLNDRLIRNLHKQGYDFNAMFQVNGGPVGLLSILLPTQNRPYYLSRALRFYEEEHLPYQIHVIDSSDSRSKENVEGIVNTSGLNLKFHDYEYGTSIEEKLQNTLVNIESPYVLMIGDDDFLFPSAISRCLQFLRDNQEYSVAHGRSYLFSFENQKLQNIVEYPQRALEMACPTSRLKSHMKNWSTTAYSVQKTENFKDVLSKHSQFSGDVRSMEIYWYAVNVIRGKVAKLDLPYMFRQTDLKKEWVANEFSIWVDQAKYRGRLIREISNKLSLENGRAFSDNEKLCSVLLARWIKDRRPFAFNICLEFSMQYYWNKLIEKLGLKNRISRDHWEVEKIRTFVCHPRQGY